MVSSTTILAFTAALGACVLNVDAHGYMYLPLAEFTDSVTAAWIVQIDPQWDGDWQDCESADDSDTCLVEVYQTLKESNGYDDIRTLLDSDTSLYGADCGYTDPDADPKDPPTDGTATFSRGMVHPGPCEIWLDDTLVLTDDNCELAYGDGTQETTTIFTPMDYSSCSDDGCMLYFYWLAFQGVDGEYVWQVYKDCVPLSGPTGSSTSTTTTSSDDTTTSTAAEADTTTSTTTDSTDYTTSSATTADATTATTDSTDYTASSTTGDSTGYTDSSTTTDSTDFTASSAMGGGDSTDYTASSSTIDMSSTTTESFGNTGGSAVSGNSGMGETMDAQGSGDQGGNGNGNGNGNGWSGGFGGMRARKLRQ